MAIGERGRGRGRDTQPRKQISPGPTESDRSSYTGETAHHHNTITNQNSSPPLNQLTPLDHFYRSHRTLHEYSNEREGSFTLVSSVPSPPSMLLLKLRKPPILLVAPFGTFLFLLLSRGYANRLSYLINSYFIQPTRSSSLGMNVMPRMRTTTCEFLSPHLPKVCEQG